ncbi:hypothetical protein BpHYR1_041877 [Brachionus plicatilis]|uniref:Uncharacterized protein n=1 Tax=Brachionus plicatilis TaxID=10195 RepID=A0A3M7QAM6_BRAPC|nr:hypothetical protein BpHYR1_041877 [Brachionus plicatilis]
MILFIHFNVIIIIICSYVSYLITGSRSSPFPVPFEHRLRPDTEATESSCSCIPLLLLS